MNLIEERTIGLAAMLQACTQVQSLARQGTSDKADVDPLLQSILVLDAINTQAVYGGLNGIRSGLSMIAGGVLRSPKAGNVEVLKYVMTIISLQKQLFADEQKTKLFARAIEQLSRFSSDELLDACSDLYKNHISELRPQIIVQGEQLHLQRAEIPPQVRALLLSAVRASVLWSQKGGGRFKLIWERTRMQNAAKALLQTQVTH